SGEKPSPRPARHMHPSSHSLETVWHRVDASYRFLEVRRHDHRRNHAVELRGYESRELVGATSRIRRLAAMPTSARPIRAADAVSIRATLRAYNSPPSSEPAMMPTWKAVTYSPDAPSGSSAPLRIAADCIIGDTAVAMAPHSTIAAVPISAVAAAPRLPN